jgi:hypothetical protein
MHVPQSWERKNRSRESTEREHGTPVCRNLPFHTGGAKDFPDANDMASFIFIVVMPLLMVADAGWKSAAAAVTAMRIVLFIDSSFYE